MRIEIAPTTEAPPTLSLSGLPNYPTVTIETPEDDVTADRLAEMFWFAMLGAGFAPESIQRGFEQVLGEHGSGGM